MRPIFSTRPAALLLASLGLSISSPAAAQNADPFVAGTRWSHAASAISPWVPSSVAFAAGGELVLASGALGSPRWLLFSSPAGNGAAQPWLASQAAPTTLGSMPVRAGDQGSELFALSQVPDPDAAHRRTEVARFDALNSAGGALARAWTHDMGWRVNGLAKLEVSRDGARTVAVLHDSALARLRIDWLNGNDGALLGRIDWNAGTLRQLSASANAERIAIAAGLELFVFDFGGALTHYENLSAATQALALSGDGQTLMVGAPGQLRVLQFGTQGFVERMRESVAAAQIPVRCALSHDGRTWAAGWWDSISGRDVRLELRGEPADALLWQEQQSAGSGSPQNYPEAVAISSDGRRAAFGLWGSLDSQPEVLLIDRATAASVARLDLAGSVTALALDPSGTRLAFGFKHAHANQFASTGEVRLFDTGERELQALNQAQWGQGLIVSARRTGANAVWFLFGNRSAQPRTLIGVGGSLWLSRAGLQLQRVSADATGRADASLPVPWVRSASGLPFTVQALFRAPGATSLSAVLLDPVSL